MSESEERPQDESAEQKGTELDREIEGSDTAVNPTIEAEPGGYTEGRDPKTEMPVIPSVPETGEERKEHGGDPGGKEPSVPE